MSTFRGLINFISDIRNCASKEDERARMYKEMGNIRQKFTKKEKLTSYEIKKYVWKMCYMWMMGYEVDFGHMEQIVHGVRNDLTRGDAHVKSLALACIANTGFPQLAGGVRSEVYAILTGTSTPSHVRKKAALCLHRILKTTPDNPFPSEWLLPLVELLKHRSLGVVISDIRVRSGLCTRVVLLLQQLVLIGSCPNEYLYKRVPCPWLQVKLFRALQLLPPPTSDTDRARLNDVLGRVLSKAADTNKCVNRNNSNHSILFEAINLIIKYGENVEAGLNIKASSLLGRYIQIRDANMRYLGLAIMAKLAAANPEATAHIKKHQATILFALKDPDVSIRQRALNLLFLMCDKSNALVVVKELLSHLENADVSIREEM
eukprot:GSChrysophyteH1.ASY1.ANO1.1419.1 assembled CDS